MHPLLSPPTHHAGSAAAWWGLSLVPGVTLQLFPLLSGSAVMETQLRRAGL